MGKLFWSAVAERVGKLLVSLLLFVKCLYSLWNKCDGGTRFLPLKSSVWGFRENPLACCTCVGHIQSMTSPEKFIANECIDTRKPGSTGHAQYASCATAMYEELIASTFVCVHPSSQLLSVSLAKANKLLIDGRAWVTGHAQ